MSGIVIEKVRKSFDTKDGVVEALKDVNLNIDSGDIYGIIGMSGAGKSTLVRCMNFLEVPTEGQVLIDGKALGDLTEKELRKQREEIGMIFQHFNLLMQKSVIDNVCFPLYIKGKNGRGKGQNGKKPCNRYAFAKAACAFWCVKAAASDTCKRRKFTAVHYLFG